MRPVTQADLAPALWLFPLIISTATGDRPNSPAAAQVTPENVAAYLLELCGRV